MDEEIDDIFHKLKENNPEMAAPKLRLWAKLIQTGQHESYEVPPPILLITGPCPSKDKKDTLTEAFSGAASAIVKALQPKTLPTTSIDDNCPSIKSGMCSSKLS